MLARLKAIFRPASARESGALIGRRELVRLAGAGVLLPVAARAAPPPAPMTPGDLSAAIRGLAALSRGADPAFAATIEAALDRLEAETPLARKLCALHRDYPRNMSDRGFRPELAVDAALIHGAAHRSRPISFAYRDLAGRETRRRVLPIEVVHPPSGILLLAWCDLRHAHRKFFLHAMSDLAIHDDSFAHRREALIDELLEGGAGV